jgi:predicted RNA-binding Zn ribbon-like protein
MILLVTNSQHMRYTGFMMRKATPLQTGSKPAPGDLAMIQGLVNTRDLETARDALAGPEQLHAWLVRVGFLEKRDVVTQDDLQHMLEVREALRMLLLANTGMPEDANALSTLNRVAARSPLVVTFTVQRASSLETAIGGVDGALGRLLAIVFHAMAKGTWHRLKACLNDACQWAFYDHSKNQSGMWCSMAACGSRIKARAYRQRKSHAGARAGMPHGSSPR